MLFMYVHTHSVDKCMVNKPEEATKMYAQAQEAAKKSSFKIVASYMAPHQHTMFIVLDANDMVALERALAPMTAWGDAELIPIITAEQMIAPQR